MDFSQSTWSFQQNMIRKFVGQALESGEREEELGQARVLEVVEVQRLV
jgi:hypothetical protein